MPALYFITHPEVVVDSEIPVERWHVSPQGIERMRAFAALPMLSDVGAIWASGETKAVEAAGILAGALVKPINICCALGENDRRATGFLPPAEFEETADAFFGRPAESVRGWERAVDAQARITRAVRNIIIKHGDGDIAIVAHGAVGTLLFCALSSQPVDRRFDQPFQGHYWRAALPDLVPETGWQPIAPRSA